MYFYKANGSWSNMIIRIRPGLKWTSAFLTTSIECLIRARCGLSSGRVGAVLWDRWPDWQTYPTGLYHMQPMIVLIGGVSCWTSLCVARDALNPRTLLLRDGGRGVHDLSSNDCDICMQTVTVFRPLSFLRRWWCCSLSVMYKRIVP